MDRTAFSVLVKSINTIYPGTINNDPATMELWYRLLCDLDYETANTALHKYMMSNHFPPKPSDIRDAVGSIRTEGTDWSEAYEDVKKAIRRYGYMQEEEGLASLPPVTRETAKRLGWMTLCTATVEDEAANRANFRMIYTSIVGKKRQDASMPEALKSVIEGIRAKSISTAKEEPPILISEPKVEVRATPEHIDNFMKAFRRRNLET